MELSPKENIQYSVWVHCFVNVNVFNSFITPFLSIFSFGADFVFRCLPILGTILSDSLVKTDTNCISMMFALLLAPVNRFPPDFSGAIPMLSCLLNLQ